MEESLLKEHSRVSCAFSPQSSPEGGHFLPERSPLLSRLKSNRCANDRRPWEILQRIILLPFGFLSAAAVTSSRPRFLELLILLTWNVH